MRVVTELPERDELGTRERWELFDHDNLTVVDAWFLGWGTSQHPVHDGHEGDYPAEGEQCGRCRWLEIRLFRDGDGDYVIAYLRATEVPDEDDTSWLTHTQDPAYVVQVLVKPPRRSAPSEEALLQASGRDTDLKAAYLGFLESAQEDLRRKLADDVLNPGRETRWAHNWIVHAGKTIRALS